MFGGIGNVFSDEILHAAKLSPMIWPSRLTDEQIERLREAASGVLSEWTDRLTRKYANRFLGPGAITAFRRAFAVHGKFGQLCPVCGTKVQRIRYAENETNYCPRCQTGGKVLADRSLSRLLKGDWPGPSRNWNNSVVNRSRFCNRAPTNDTLIVHMNMPIMYA